MTIFSQARARRSGVGAVVAATAAALVLTLGVTGVERTSAAYTDQVTGVTSDFSVPAAGFFPQQTFLNGTGTALQDDGSIAVWGFRGNGLSGTGVATVPFNDAISMTRLPSDGHPEGTRRAVKLAGVSQDNYYPTIIGMTGIAALSDDGRVYTWGGNQANNVMGRPATPVPWNQPGQVEIPGTVVDLTSSFGVFMALTSTGDLYTWGWAQGRGITGQGAASTSNPVPTKILDGVHSIGAGGWNGWAIRGNTVEDDPQTGVLWWGWANPWNSMAGDPSGDGAGAPPVIVPVPTQSQALSQYTTQGCEAVGVVAGSEEDTCGIQTLTGHYYGSQALLRDGTLLAWGNPAQWGSGGLEGQEATVPTPVIMPDGVDVVRVGRTQDYVMLHGSDQLLYVYGRYSFGGGPHPETGEMSRENHRTPTPLTALGPVTHVGGHGYTGQARRSDGTLVLWGGGEIGAPNNPYRAVRNSFAHNTTTNVYQPLTELVMPGTERSLS